jgi:NADH-quinone oxidoreductase subunit N
MIVANEMLTFFISLEVMSLSIYAMSAAAVASRLVREEKTKSSLLNILSSEAALKYFVLGSLASAIMLYGIALIYGLSGSFFFNEIQASLVRVESKLFYLAIGLILAALLFKVGAVPFHYWTPDVYQGAPAPSTAFMSAVVKIAALVVMYKLFWIVFQREVIFWSGVVWLAALLSIIIGSLASLQQSSFRRLIAYSGIANVGYLLGALLVVGREEVADLGPLIYYLSVYLLASGGLLIISSELEARSLSATSSSDIEAGAVKQLFTGLFSRNRFIALAALFFLLTLAGLPPAISGLIGKISVLSAVVKGGYAGLAIISLISSLILAYVYLSIIALIFSKNSQPEESNFYKSNQAFNLSLIACLTMLVLLSAQFSL